MMALSVIGNVADTARWVAMYRALESERRDAHFHDPHARQLAGERGERILATLPRSVRNAAWSVVARTVMIDEYVRQQVAGGVTLVLNLAAGLDSRPYRLPLPPTLTWVEVDQPALLAEKAGALAGETPTCILERIPVDLSQAGPRRELFARIGAQHQKVLVVTEGLIMYLAPDEATGLASDLAAVPAFQSWVTDLISPVLLQMIERDWGTALRAGGASMRFAPESGPVYFADHGWRTVECRSAFRTAARLRRLPWFLHLLSLLPGDDRFQAKRPWSGVALLERA